MTQQPNQNYPQPGQGWGQPGQQPQQQQWGQPAAPQQQWGQPAQAPAAPAYGQPTQAAWGGAGTQSPYSGGAAPAAGTVGKVWALYGAVGAAVISIVTLFLSWAGFSVKESAAGQTFDVKSAVTAFSVKTTANGKTVPNDAGDHPTRIWGILIILGVVVLIAGAVLTLLKKNKTFAWVQTVGAVIILGSAIAEVIYLNGKMSDAKKTITDGSMPDGAKYSIGLQYGAWVALVVAIAAVAFSVLSTLSLDASGAGAGSAAYAAAYGQPQQAAYGQPAYGQPAAPQQQWGQAAPAQPQQWGQQEAQPAQQQWGQPQANPFGDPANQPTQAVQQQYPPQPPQ